jgi:hypothetical protein
VNLADRQLSLETRLLMARATAEVGPGHSVYDDAPAPRKSIEQRFLAFHAANPHVLAELLKLARRAKGRGVSRIGIRMLWEVLRWQLTVETYDPAGDPYKLNDHFHSRYARLLLEADPSLEGLIELRELRAH